MEKIWKVNKKAPKSFLNKFPEYSKITLQLLWDRGLRTQKAIDEFFNPDYNEDLHDPFLLKDVRKTIKRIEEASKKREKVAIFADYDADGVCGATILNEILKIFKIKPDIYIPDRNREGYGLNLDSIKEIANKGIGLVLTIDCGVTDLEEIELANKLGIDVLVVDHHEIPKKLPSAFAIINPKQKTCKYPFKQLSAAGVAFKVAQAVARIKKIPISWEKWLLDLVAISTVGDSMLLLGENRTLVTYGLIVLSQTKRIGLEALMEKARIKPAFNPQTLGTNLTSCTLGFVLVPRINAASRVDHGLTAYNLLIASNKDKANKIADELEKKNKERQKTVEKILVEARQNVLRHLGKKKVIIEGDENWIAGVAGLVAQKLTDEFWRPSFIYQKLKDFIAGSTRGIPGFNVVSALYQCKKFLKEFGGHPGAAGFKISNNNLNNFKNCLEETAFKQIKKRDLIPRLYIDAEVEIKDLTWIFFKEICSFAPFGEGNRAPLFLLKKLIISEIKTVGSNGNHLKIFFEKGDKKFKAIGFGLADFHGKIKTGDKADVVFELISNEWNGTKELQLKIADIKKSKL